MKSIFIAAAILLISTPSHAFWAVRCDGPKSGFIQVGNQVECIRHLTPEELRAARKAAEAEAYARKRKRVIADAQARRDRAELQMDIAQDNIMEPGGRRNYRRALDSYIDASVDLKKMNPQNP